MTHAYAVTSPARRGAKEGTYTLPPAVLASLMAALRGRRNLAACLALATFLARHWSMPHRLGLTFWICREGLSKKPELGLTQDQIRGAIRALVEIGFLDQLEQRGSGYERKEGRLQRKPNDYRIAQEYAAEFLLANAKSRKIERRPPRFPRPQDTSQAIAVPSFWGGAGRAPGTPVAAQPVQGLAGCQPAPMPMLSLEARQTRVATGRRW